MRSSKSIALVNLNLTIIFASHGLERSLITHWLVPKQYEEVSNGLAILFCIQKHVI